MRIIQKKRVIKKSFYSSNQNLLEYLFSIFLWQESFPPLVSHFLFIAGRFQLICIIIWNQFQSVTQHPITDPLTTYLEKFTGIFADSDALGTVSEFNSLSLRIQLMTIYAFLIAGIFIALIYCALRSYTSKKLELLACTVGAIHHEILFWYINVTCLTGMRRGDIQFDYFGIQTVSGAWGSYLMFICILLINFVFWIISVCFRYDPFKTSDPVSCWKPFCHITTGCLKAILSLILVCMDRNYNSTLVFWIIAVVGASFQKYVLHQDIPFYYRETMRLALVFNSVILVITYCSLILTIFIGLNSTSKITLIYGQALLLALVIKIGLEIYEKQQKSSIAYLLSGPKKEEEVFQAMQIVNRISENSRLTMDSYQAISGVEEVYWFSLMKYHQKTCRKDDCVCHMLLSHSHKSFSFLNMKNNINEIMQEVLYGFFKTTSRSMKSYRVKIYLCFLELKKRTSGRRALITLFSIPKAEISLLLRVGMEKLITQLKNNLNFYYNQSNSHDLDITELFAFEQSSTRFLQQLKEASNDYLNFWHFFTQNKIKSTELIQASKIFENKATLVEKYWANLQSDFPQHSKMNTFEYAKYLALYRNSSSKAEKYLKHYNEWLTRNNSRLINHTLTRENLLDPNNITVYVSMHKDNLGIIVDASNSIEALGYKKKELLGENINTLIMNCLQTQHHISLQKHIDINPNEERLYSKITTFAKNRRGTIIQVEAYLAISPKFDDELIYMGILRQVNPDKDFIVINCNGEIDSYTDKLYEKYDIEVGFGSRLRDIFHGTKQIDDYVENERSSDINSRLTQPETKYIGSVDEINTHSEEKRRFAIKLKNCNDPDDGKFLVNLTKVNVLGTYFYSLELIPVKRIKANNSANPFENITLGREAFEALEAEIMDDEAENMDEGSLAQGTIYQKTSEVQINKESTEQDPRIEDVYRTQKTEKSTSNRFVESYDFVSDSEETLDGKENTKKLKLSMRKSSMSQKSNSRVKLMVHQEEALFEVHTSLLLKILKSLLLLFWIVTTACLITYSVIKHNDTQKIKSYIDFANYIGEFSSALSSNFIILHQLDFSQRGLFSLSRYSTNITNDEYLKAALINSLNSLLLNNQEYLNLVISPNPVLDNPITFQGTDYIESQKMILPDYYKLAITFLDRILHTNNFLSSQEEVQIIQKHDFKVLDMTYYIITDIISMSRDLYNSSSDILVVFLIVTIVFGSGILGLEIYCDSYLENNSRRLFESLNRIDTTVITELLNDLKIKKAQRGFNHKNSAKEGKAKSRSSRQQIDYIRTVKSVKNTIFLISSVLLHIISFAILKIQQSNESNNGSALLGSVSDLELFAKLNLAFQEMYPLILQNLFKSQDPNLAEANFEEIWNTKYEKIISLQNDLRVKLNQKDDSISPYLSDNLCNSLAIVPACKTKSKYVVNGLYGFNNGIANLLNDLRGLSITSTGSVNSVKSVVETHSFADFEKIAMEVFEPVYSVVLGKAQENFNALVDTKAEEITDYWTIFTVVLFFMMILERIIVVEPILKIESDTRKIMRIVPLNIIMNNNFIKAYLRDNASREYQHVFK